MAFMPLPSSFHSPVQDLLHEATEAVGGEPTVSTTTVTAAIPSTRAAEEEEAELAGRARRRSSLFPGDRPQRSARSRDKSSRRARKSRRQSQHPSSLRLHAAEDDGAAVRQGAAAQDADLAALGDMAALLAEATASAVTEAAGMASESTLLPMAPDDFEPVTAVDMAGTETASESDDDDDDDDDDGTASTASTAVTTLASGARVVDLDELLAEATAPADRAALATPLRRVNTATAAQQQRPSALRRFFSKAAPVPTSPQRAPRKQRTARRLAQSTVRRTRTISQQSGDGSARLNLQPTVLEEVQQAHATEAQAHADAAAAMAAMAIDIARNNGQLPATQPDAPLTTMHPATLKRFLSGKAPGPSVRQPSPTQRGSPLQRLLSQGAAAPPSPTMLRRLQTTVHRRGDGRPKRRTVRGDGRAAAAGHAGRQAVEGRGAGASDGISDDTTEEEEEGAQAHQSGSEAEGGVSGASPAEHRLPRLSITAENAGNSAGEQQGPTKDLVATEPAVALSPTAALRSTPRRIVSFQSSAAPAAAHPGDQADGAAEAQPAQKLRRIQTLAAAGRKLSVARQRSTRARRATAPMLLPSEDEGHHQFLDYAVPDTLSSVLVGASVVEQEPVTIHEGFVSSRPDAGAAESATTHVATTGATVSTPLARTVIMTTTTTTQADINDESTTDGDMDAPDLAAITTTTTTIVTYPKPQPSKGRPMLITLMVALLPLTVGFTLGYTSPISTSLTQPTESGGAGFSESEASFFGACVNLGAAAGALSGFPLLNMLGRRGALIASAAPFIIGYLLLATTGSYEPLLVGRLLTGMGVGLGSLVAPTYLAEIAPPLLRGALGTVYQLATVSGILFVYGLGVTYGRQTLAWVGCAVPSLFILGMLPMPGSPSFLLSRGRRKAALRAMVRIRGEQYDCEGELSLIERSLADAKATAATMTLPRLFQGANLRAMIVTLGVMTLLQLCGINSVVFFSGAIFEAANYDDPAIGALITAVINVVVTFMSSLVVDRYGRRPLLMLSMVGSSASLAILGVFFYLQDNGQNAPGLMALLSLMFYNVFFAVGLGPLPWLIASEVLPAQARNLGSSVTVLYTWMLAFVITKTFANMLAGLTSAGTFWFYAASVVPGLYYAVCVLPETKGRSLEDIEAYFTRLAGKPSARAGGAGPEDTDMAVQLTYGDSGSDTASSDADAELTEQLIFTTSPSMLGGRTVRRRSLWQ